MLDILVHDNSIGQSFRTISDALNGLGYKITMENGAKLNRNTKFIADYMEQLNVKDLMLGIVINTVLYGNTCIEFDFNKEIEPKLPRELRILPFNKVKQDTLNYKLYYFKNGIKTYVNPYVYKRYKNIEIYLEPQGDGLIFDVAALIILKQGGLDTWQKMLKSTSYPSRILKTGMTDPKKIAEITKKLEGINPLSIIVDTASSFENHVSKPETDAHKQFVEFISTEITKLILGQNLTSEVKSGSQAAAKTLKEILAERIGSFSVFANGLYSDILNHVLICNNINDRIKFEYNKVINLNTERAERDSILFTQGVRPQKQYYDKHYDFEEGDIIITNIDTQTNTDKTNNQSLNLSKQNLFTKEQEGIEQLNNEAMQAHEAGFALAVLETIKKSKNKEDLIANFASLMETYEHEQDFSKMHDALISADIYGYVTEKQGE
ncbi:MAG TPA: DUF935 family protein [Bacteroidia bacterium]|nr:DUF935 family protein [Bacteroidia bacterium]